MQYVAQLARKFENSDDNPDVFVNKETVSSYLNNDAQTL